MKSYETEITVIIRVCGHSEEVEIRKYKQPRNRVRKIEDLESRLCWACYVKETRKKYDLVPMRMHYSAYKRLYRRCLVDGESYNEESKNITIYVRKEHRPVDTMKRYLVDECDISYEQADYLVEASSRDRYRLEEWFELTSGSEAFKIAVQLIYKNDPSHYYIERLLNDDDMPF